MRSLLLLVALAGCSSSEAEAAVDAGGIDAGPCPATASTCPTGCTEWTARQIDPARRCLSPSAPVTCLAPNNGCTGAVVCLARTSDNVAFWFPGDCHRPGWRACTEAESAGTEYNSAPCPP